MIKKKDPINFGSVLEYVTMDVTLVGTTLLCVHNWAQKSKQEMKDKHEKTVKTGPKEKRNPEKEWKEAHYIHVTTKKPVIPCTFLKKAMTNAAHVDLGIPKTKVTGNVFVTGFVTLPEGKVIEDTNFTEITGEVTPFHTMDSADPVRLSGPGRKADLRYRPKWENWAVRFRLEITHKILPVEHVLQLITLAGKVAGFGEGRPQNQTGLDWGRFYPDLKSVELSDPKCKDAEIQEVIQKKMSQLLKSKAA